MQLTDFRILTFDTFGTLIDWEAGILQNLAPLLDQLPDRPTDDQVLELYAKLESAQQEATPTMLWSDILTEVHQQLAAEWGIPVDAAAAQRFGASIGRWPAFADAPPALAELKRHYKLVTVTNCDNQSYDGCDASLGRPWDAIWTAEKIGSYKPDPANFTYLIEHVRSEFGFEPSQILHVAQSLYHDHAPAKAIGLTTAWIDRRHGVAGAGATKVPDSIPEPDLYYHDMTQFAEAVRQAHAGGSG